MSDRKSTKDYWETNWKDAAEGIKPDKKSNLFWRQLDAFFQQAFAGLKTEQLSLIEIGAGGSEWLPKLHHDFKFDVSGIDYTEEGCKRCLDILKAHQINGNIYQADMFESTPELENRFDIVCSFGLVEHFEDTAKAIAACAKHAKPGGLIITMIPNMKGINGFFYKVLNRKVFDTHVPLSLDDLCAAHENAALILISKCHILSLPGVIDGNRHETQLVRKILRKSAYLFTKFTWWFQSNLIAIPGNAYTSPYMICVAQKPMNQ